MKCSIEIVSQCGLGLQVSSESDFQIVIDHFKRDGFVVHGGTVLVIPTWNIA